MMRLPKKFLLAFSLLAMSLTGCAQLELASHFGKKAAGSNVPTQGYYKVGNPYKIMGKRYYPEVDFDYNETGIASWYGPNFHGKMTANGETFDQNELTAAHRTLPLPSIVRVTNLENGKSLIVRVNDRGPYAHGRIIDMSKRSAELLGFRIKGTAKVRVQILEQESKMVEKMARAGQDTRGVEVPMNRRGYKSPKAVPQTQLASVKAEPAKVQPAVLTTNSQGTSSTLSVSDKQAIPGHIKNGNFYPDPIIAEHPVKAAQRVYVQVASFSTRENAMRFSSSLDHIGRAQIQPKVIDGVTYYRVRFSTNGVPEADAVLEKVIADGYQNARIVVD